MNSDDAPFVSVLMPVFNAGRFLAQSIRSVLAQEFSDFELILVDDGSTDDSLKIARSFSDPRIRVISLAENTGFVSALNTGLAEARGVWVARQDGDDLSPRERLRQQVNLAIANPDVELLYSDAVLIDEAGHFRGRLYSPQTNPLFQWDLCFRNAIPHSSVMFRRREVFEDLGGYRRDNVSADYDLWTRIMAKGHALKCPGLSVRYRLHSRSIMGTENAAAKKASLVPLREIMLENISRFITTAFAPEDWEIILEAWTDGENPDWPTYFSRRNRLLSLFTQKHGVAPGMPHLMSQQDYTLFHRILKKSRRASFDFLSSLAKNNLDSFGRLPWLKTAYSLAAG